VRSLEYGVSGMVDDFNILLSELLSREAIADHKVFAGDNNLLIDVLDEGLDKRCSNFLYSLFKPDIVMEELSFAS